MKVFASLFQKAAGNPRGQSPLGRTSQGAESPRLQLSEAYRIPATESAFAVRRAANSVLLQKELLPHKPLNQLRLSYRRT